MANYLDYTGLSYFWTKLKAYFATISHVHGNITNDGKLNTASRVVISNGDKSITTSDVTTSELNVLDGITATTAELNVLDGITATTAELNYCDGVTSGIQTQLDNRYTKSDVYTKTEIDTKLTSAMVYKGTVATLTALNAIANPSTGDFYNVTENGANYAWDGSTWDQVGFAVEFDSITTGEIDTVVAS